MTLARFPYYELAGDVGSPAGMCRVRSPAITLARNVWERRQVDKVLALASAAGGQVVKPAGERTGAVTGAVALTPMVTCGRWPGGAFDFFDDGSRRVT